MEKLITIIIYLSVSSIGSALLSGLLLLLNNKWLHKISSYLLYLAGGTLLGSALLGLIPEATERLGIHQVLLWVLIGIVFFFVLEKIILWRTCQDEECERQNHAAAPMIIIGDAFHSGIDGVVIAASFLTSVQLGIFITISVILHEIPHKLGDFAILIKGGFSRGKALLYNVLSGSTSLVFGILSYYLLDKVTSVTPYTISIAAASFLYISLADLIPEMHKETKPKESIIQIFIILLGIFIMLLSMHHH